MEKDWLTSRIRTAGNEAIKSNSISDWIVIESRMLEACMAVFANKTPLQQTNSNEKPSGFVHLCHNLTYRGKYSESFPEAAEFYNSYSGFGDEFLWSAAWLYRVTGENRYQQDYEKWWTEFNLNWRPAEASWDFKLAQAQVLLSKIDRSQKYVDAARSFCDWVVDQAPKTPRGLVFLSQWGSLRHASNAVLVCLQTAEAGVNAEKYRTFAKQQLDYMLGNGGRSFVCGYGNNPPLRPHHAAASCPNRPASCSWNDFSKPDPNPQVLNGALVGGPDNINDNYEDNRENYVTNEVTIDYNAGFQSALAGLCKLHC